MLIVSQDKKSIYNFNNMKSLDLVGNQIFVTDDTLADEGVRIGKYRTKERAKQVLEEIADCYAFFQILYSPNVSIQKTIKGKKLKEVIVYEMPEE